MNRRIFVFLFATLLGLFTTGSLFASAAEAKARMKERVSTLNQLKQSEAIGENNQGFVEVRKPGGDAAAVVAAENKDREELFADTATRTGGTAATVGKSFAKQLAGRPDAVGWFLREDGTWYKK